MGRLIKWLLWDGRDIYMLELGFEDDGVLIWAGISIVGGECK